MSSFSSGKTKFIILLLILAPFIKSCGNFADARKVSPNPKDRVQKNLEEGKGFRIMDMGDKSKNTNYEFASSNPLWRASLDVIDFMPLATANYSGGIIVTDWFSNNESNNESVKISIRFLTNEIRSDALNIKVFYKNCKSIGECSVKEDNGKLSTELTSEILKTATIYQQSSDEKSYKPYVMPPEKKRN